MTSRLSEFGQGRAIFVDANIFAYHHSSHPRFGSSCTDFLRKIEDGAVHAVTSNVVQHEVLYFLQMHRGEAMTGISDRSLLRAKIAGDRAFAAECWEAAEQFLALFETLQAGNLTVFEVESSHARQIVQLGCKYQLILRDASHAAVCRLMNLADIASNDSDFDGVDFLTRWRPGI